MIYLNLRRLFPVEEAWNLMARSTNGVFARDVIVKVALKNQTFYEQIVSVPQIDAECRPISDNFS